MNDPSFFCSHRLPIAIAAARRGYDVHVATPSGPAVEAILHAGLRHHPLSLSRRGLGFVEEAGVVVSLVRLYRSLRPRIVHHVTMKPVLYGSIAAALARVPAVVNAVSGLGYLFLSEGWIAQLRRGMALALARAGSRRPNVRAIFQNRDDAALFVAKRVVEPAQVVIIAGSGVDLSRYRALPAADGTPVIVLAARILWDKGVGEFVEAARLLRDRGVAARFVLVGESDPGNPAAVPGIVLATWHEEAAVEWWGRRDDMPAVLAAASIVCLPSYREGMPKVLLEAAACGRPSVTTDVPGCRDAVVHGVTGLIVPPRDAFALANALETLIVDTELRTRMGRAARLHAEQHFDVHTVVQATLDLYHELQVSCASR